jgi:hypothetical protein
LGEKPNTGRDESGTGESDPGQQPMSDQAVVVFDYLSDTQDVRFNFFISPQIGNYLDWVSKNKRIPRAVYLRRLIEEDMKNNKEYERD